MKAMNVTWAVYGVRMLVASIVTYNDAIEKTSKAFKALGDQFGLADSILRADLAARMSPLLGSRLADWIADELPIGVVRSVVLR